MWALLSRHWIDGVPVHFFAIDHRDGLVLFDTGLDPAIANDPRQYLGSALAVFFVNRLFRWHIGPEDNVRDPLTQLGHDVASVRTVVFSRLHFDHTGCLEHLLHARRSSIARHQFDTTAATKTFPSCRPARRRRG